VNLGDDYPRLGRATVLAELHVHLAVKTGIGDGAALSRTGWMRRESPWSI
jgi:hypothetical protein